MSRVTNGYGEMEFVVTPETTHILIRYALLGYLTPAPSRGFNQDCHPTRIISGQTATSV
jgi:hypothetical protein